MVSEHGVPIDAGGEAAVDDTRRLATAEGRRLLEGAQLGRLAVSDPDPIPHRPPGQSRLR